MEISDFELIRDYAIVEHGDALGFSLEEESCFLYKKDGDSFRKHLHSDGTSILEVVFSNGLFNRVYMLLWKAYGEQIIELRNRRVKFVMCGRGVFPIEQAEWDEIRIV